jgi:predicted enzyme related to lactoylglutathione lyase
MSLANGLITVIIYVSDMDRSVSFYVGLLGLKAIHAVASYTNETWVELDAGASKLALHAGGSVSERVDGINLVFSTSDLASARNRLSNDGIDVSADITIVPGIQFFRCHDPDGNNISIQSE